MEPQTQHLDEIQRNLALWKAKPLLRKIYREFHTLMASFVRRDVPGLVVELGAGIGTIKEVIHDCVCADLFPNPWLDRVEDVYKLSFGDGQISNILMFDVFHHLRYPGLALAECRRVLVPGGRLILFEPYIRLLGRLVYGIAHQEPVAWNEEIEWTPQNDGAPDLSRYYAAQGNATRVFWSNSFDSELVGWKLVARQRLAALSYILSGGYSGPQLYPTAALGGLLLVDRILDSMPRIFATRTLICLEADKEL